MFLIALWGKVQLNSLARFELLPGDIPPNMTNPPGTFSIAWPNNGGGLLELSLKFPSTK
jgi:hypothetical protein